MREKGNVFGCRVNESEKWLAKNKRKIGDC